VAVLAVAAACLLAPLARTHGGPNADSSHFLSVVIGVVPPVPGLELAVAERDDRLVVTNNTGKTVIVSGYTLEPYLRFDARGVWVNRHSPSRWLDTLRYVPENYALPKEANEKLPPEWLLLTPGNTWEWHDHRIQWMGSSSPAGTVTPVNGTFDLRDWEVGIHVDGSFAIIKGRLDYFVEAQTGSGAPSSSRGSAPWTVLAIVLPLAAVLAAAGGWLLVRRRRGASAAA